jgi:hypothetical protein
MTYQCRICSREFEELPVGRELKRRFGIVLIQMDDKNKTVHEFRVMPKAKRKTVEPEPKPNLIVLPPKSAEPEVTPVAVKPARVPTLLPEPMSESQFGTMAAAFNVLRNKFQNSTQEKE